MTPTQFLTACYRMASYYGITLPDTMTEGDAVRAMHYAGVGHPGDATAMVTPPLRATPPALTPEVREALGNAARISHRVSEGKECSRTASHLITLAAEVRRLQSPVGEPVAWMLRKKSNGFIRGLTPVKPDAEWLASAEIDGDEYIPLYTTPPALTPEVREAELLLETIQTGRVTLICPSCKQNTEAKTERVKDWPYWDVLIHDCECGYTITESDWQVALAPPLTPQRTPDADQT